MPAHLWSDTGTWIAIGISVLFLVVALAMHLVIRRILKSPPTEPESKSTHE
jgi:hypothetical protein